MSEKLTKTALKSELTRRIEWFEKSYKFDNETTLASLNPINPHLIVAFGRYLSLIEVRWQIEKGLFIGGYAC